MSGLVDATQGGTDGVTEREEGTGEGPTKPTPFAMGKIGRHSMVYAVGFVLSKAVAFLMLPIYTRYLDPTDYGILQLCMMTLEVISIVAGSRIAYGIFHFYHKAPDEDARRSVLSTAVLLLAVTYTAAALMAIALAPEVASLVFGDRGKYVLLLRLAAISMVFEGVIVVPTALLQLRQHSKLFVVVNLVRLGLQVVLNLILLIPLEMGVTGVLVSGVITNGVIGLGLTIHLLVSVGPRFKGAAAREFLRFGLPLVAMQIATFVYTFGDRYFLNKVGDEAAVGLYGLAYQFGFLLGTVSFMPFQLVWEPQRFEIAKRPDRDAIFSRAFVYFNVALISAGVALSLFVGDVLRVIAAPAFHSAAAFVPIILIAYVFQAWGTFHNFGIYITEKTEYFMAANWLAAIVAVAGYVLLIPRWLAWGAALTVVASLATRFGFAYFFSQRLWRIRYEWGPVLWLGALGLIVGVIGALPPRFALPISIGWHFSLFCVYAALLWRLPILTDTDRSAIRRVLRIPARLAARA